MKSTLSRVLLALLLLWPAVASAALSSSTVWEVRGTNGADTNGGGYVAGSTGTDWSQQNSPQYAVADAVTAGTTTITSATAAFGTDIVGNICYVQGGTGSVTAGWYQVASRTNATTIVMDRSTGLTAGTGVTLNCGGALKTLSQLSSIMVSGNKAFVKAESTYTTTSTITFTAGGNNPHARIIGYTSSRTDGGKATLQMSSGSSYYGLTLSGNVLILENFIVDANNLTTSGCITNTSAAQLLNVKCMNYTNIGLNAISTFLQVEVTGGSGTPTAGIQTGNAGFYGMPFVHDGVGPGIVNTGSSQLVIWRPIVANMSGATSDCILNSGVTVEWVAHNCGRNGLSAGAASSNWFMFMALSGIATSNGAYGLNGSTFQCSMPATRFWDGNAFYNNTTAARGNVDDTTGCKQNGTAAYTNAFDVTLSGLPYVNAGTLDFSLNNTVGQGLSAQGAGAPTTWPGGSGSMANHPDMGAVQHNTAVTCTTQSCGY